MPFPRRQLSLTIASLLAIPMLAGPVTAQAPVCKGTDITAELARDKQAEWARIAAASENTLNAKAIFWKIEKAAKAPSYLFGTVHLTDDRVNALPPAVDKALLSAKTVALEVPDLSPKAMAPALAQMQQLLIYTDGRSLLQMLSEDERAIANRALQEAGTPPEALAGLRPWVVAMMLALSSCERKRSASGLAPLDQRLGDKARAKGIPVVGLETRADQMQAMAKVPDADQLTMLRASLKLYHRTDDMIETMVQRYLKRELGVIWPLQEEMWRAVGHDPAAFRTFQKELLGVRNIKMRDAALPLLTKGGAFIAVGALHLPGNDGLVELFRQAGYTVTAAE